MEIVTSKTAQVIDAQGYVVPGAFVMLEYYRNPQPGIEPEYLERIHGGRELQPGQTLVYGGAAPTNMVKPRWSGTEWEEAANAKEIAAAAYRKLQSAVNNMDPDSVTHEQILDHIRVQRRQEVGAACEQAIYAGTTAQTSQGMEQFSLKNEDQINIQNLVMQAQSEQSAVLYHADGKLCRAFSPEEVMSLATAATTAKTVQLTYCNHLNNWIKRETYLDVLQGIHYGSELPQDLADHMQAVLAAGEEVLET